MHAKRPRGRALLFVDIDGVLGHYGTDGKLDPRCVARLDAIVSATGAQVVITSSWRERYTPAEIEDILRALGFTGAVVGETPVLLGQPRGAEIRAYLDDAGEVARFAILDDNPDLAGVEDHAVMVDDFVGLSDADARACIALLGTPDQPRRARAGDSPAPNPKSRE